MMSHIYEGLPRSNVSEAGGEIPGHGQDLVIPVMEESGQVLVGVRWELAVVDFCRGRERQS